MTKHGIIYDETAVSNLSALDLNSLKELLGLLEKPQEHVEEEEKV